MKAQDSYASGNEVHLSGINDWLDRKVDKLEHTSEFCRLSK
jgi:hypothetical protein